MTLAELVHRPVSLDALRAELPGFEKRRAFVAGASGFALRQLCAFVIVHPDTGSRFDTRAEVVWIPTDGSATGVGVELLELDLARLRAFCAAGAGESEVRGEPRRGPSTEGQAPSASATGDEPEDRSVADDRSPAAAGGAERGTTLFERVRRLSLREREHCARSGSLSERVALERAFGSSVWESLLANPQLSAPEVARIAKNGTLSQPLIGAIVANGGWVAVGEVQRALLSNPRVNGAPLDRVLRALPAADLKRVGAQTAYRTAVRQAAQRLLKG